MCFCLFACMSVCKRPYYQVVGRLIPRGTLGYSPFENYVGKASINYVVVHVAYGCSLPYFKQLCIQLYWLDFGITIFLKRKICYPLTYSPNLKLKCYCENRIIHLLRQVYIVVGTNLTQCRVALFVSVCVQTQLASQPTQILKKFLGCIPGCLYVSGGAILEDGDGIELVQRYDSKSGEWTEVAGMLIPRS